jgi:hypothetical protein
MFGGISGGIGHHFPNEAYDVTELREATQIQSFASNSSIFTN